MIKQLLAISILLLCANGAFAATPSDSNSLQALTGETSEGWFMQINDENQPTVFVQKASAKKLKSGHTVIGRGVYCYDTIYNTVCRWYPGVDYDSKPATGKELERICSSSRLDLACPHSALPGEDPWEL